LGAHVLLELCHTLRSIGDKRLLPLRNHVVAARSPKLHRSSDVDKRKTGAKFGGHWGGPRHDFFTTKAQLDRAQDVANRPRRQTEAAGHSLLMAPVLPRERWSKPDTRSRVVLSRLQSPEETD